MGGEAVRGRARLAVTAIMMALLLVAAACQRDGTGPGAGEEPQRGGNIVIGWDQEPAILNGFITGGDLFATSVVTSMMLRGSHRINPGLEFEPHMITRTPSTDNGDLVVEGDKMSITWRLRDGLQWSDGQPITSEDYEFTWQTIMNPDNSILSREGYDQIESVDASDPQAFTANFKALYNQWILLFNAILPKHDLEGKDFDQEMLEEVRVSSGPFIFGEWAKGDSITLNRNDNFWGEHTSYLDSVTFRYITDTAALKNAFRAGEVEFIQPPPDIAQVEEIQAFPGVTVKIESGTVWEHLAFQHQNGLEKKEVREAIAYGIDRNALTEQRLKGQVAPLQSFVVPELAKFTSDPWAKYTRDVEKAKQLMQQAGYSPEKPLKLTISTTSGNTAREDNEAYFQQQLAEIGIELTIENHPATTFFGEVTPQGTFQIGEWAWLGSPGYAGAASLVDLFAPDQIPTEANDFEGQNYYRYNNPEILTIKNQLKTTLDEDEGAELIKKVAQIMADDVAILPLYQRIDPIAYIESIRGPENNPSQEGPFWNIEDWWKPQAT